MSRLDISLVYVVPVHNDEEILEGAVAQLRKALAGGADHRIIVVENGSNDRSYEKARTLSTTVSPAIHAFREESAGIGFAYDRGLREGLLLVEPENDSSTWFVLTASDLPFGFTDLSAFKDWLERGTDGAIAIGSKSHPESAVSKSMMRQLSSLVYRMARLMILGMRTVDSQGSFFLRADLARALVPQIRARDFFYSTELTWLAERCGRYPKELPVTLAPGLRPSTVRPLRDGFRMLASLIGLRRSSKKEGRGAPEDRRAA